MVPRCRAVPTKCGPFQTASVCVEAATRRPSLPAWGDQAVSSVATSRGVGWVDKDLEVRDISPVAPRSAEKLSMERWEALQARQAEEHYTVAVAAAAAEGADEYMQAWIDQTCDEQAQQETQDQLLQEHAVQDEPWEDQVLFGRAWHEEALHALQEQAREEQVSGAHDGVEWDVNDWAEDGLEEEEYDETVENEKLGADVEKNSQLCDCWDCVIPCAAAPGIDCEDGGPAKAKLCRRWSVRELVTLERWPVFTVLQVLVVGGLWLFFVIRSGDRKEDAGLESAWPGLTDLMVQEDCEEHRREVWRWLTYQFTHSGLPHLIVNLVAALVLGVPLEGHQGMFRTAIGFNLSVLGGACGHLVADNHSRVVGMSGGVYGLVGLHVGDAATGGQGRRKRGICGFLLLLGAVGLVEAAQAFIKRDVPVSHAVHIGGFIAGFMAWVALGRRPAWSRIAGVWPRTAAWFVGLAMVAGCAAWGLSSAVPMDPYEGVRWCWDRQVINSTLFGDGEPRCVRCDNSQCIARWSIQRHIQPVPANLCSKLGGWAVTER